MTPRLVSTPTARPFSIEDPVDAGLRVHFDAALDRLLGVAPGDGVVARDGARRMIERAEDRIAHVVGNVDGRAQPLDLVRPDDLRVDAEVLVDLGAPARRAHRRVRVREREVPALGVHHVDVEIVRQPAPQADGLFVELHAFGRQVVGADDRGVARGVAARQPALVEHADVFDAVLGGEVVGDGETVPAGADDDHVVGGLELRAPAEVRIVRMFLGQRILQEGEGHWSIGLRGPRGRRGKRHMSIPRVQENFRSFKCPKYHHAAELIGLTLEGPGKSGLQRLDNLRQPVAEFSAYKNRLPLRQLRSGGMKASQGELNAKEH